MRTRLNWIKAQVELVNFNESHQSVLDALLLDKPGVHSGKMLGYPAYFAGEKLSICLVGEGVGLKLPSERAAALLAEDPHTSPFHPLGQPKMREWLQINPVESEDLQVFEESFK